MTCDELAHRLDAWQNGALPEMKARALEQHAAECVSCYARLDAASRPARISRRVTPPPALRSATLGAVRQQRRRTMVRRAVVGIGSIAAIALIAIMLRPRTKSASDFPGAGIALMAADRARPSLVALDAAENEIKDALSVTPDDPELTDALARIQHQRDELTRLVREAAS